MKYADTTIILPTLDERRNILKLLGLLTKLFPGARIIVSDDGSSDGTQAAVRGFASNHKAASLLDRSRRRVHGLTASVLDALLLVKTPFSIVMDGDLQHPPEKVGELVRALRRGPDLAIGVRISVEEDWPLPRRIMSYGASSLGYLRLLLGGRRTNDVLSGFFGIRTALAKSLITRNRSRFVDAGYKVLFDFLKLLSLKQGIAEVPYRFGNRAGGSSKIRFRHILLYAKSIFT